MTRVLDLTVAMKMIFLHLLLPLMMSLGAWSQVTPGLYFLSPAEGEVVSGTVAIKGSLPEDGFSYAELSYAFSDGQSENWFLITRMEQVVHDDVLAYWDTTTITDGVYRLRLSVHEKNNTVHEIYLENIRVGNYTHFETPTATISAILPVETQSMAVEPTATQIVVQSPQPTDLPENPAAIEPSDFKFSMGAGLVLAVLILAVLGIYAYFRQAARK